MRGRADDGLHHPLRLPPLAAAADRRPRLRRLRPGHAAGDPEALPLGAAGGAGGARRGARRAALPGPGGVAHARPLHRRGVRPPLRRGARRRASSWRRSTPATGPGSSGRSSWTAWRPFSANFPCRAPRRTTPPSRRPHVRAARRARPGVRGAWLRRIDPWHVAPVVAAIVFAIVYLIWEPRTVDLAAHTFRADLFGEEGFTIWNGQWYGGHHTPAYSIISPPLAWLLGPPVALALAAVASAALFPPLARGAFGDKQARWGSLWFGIAHGHAAVHRAAAVRARRGLRPGRAARPATAPLRLGDRVRRALPARQPGGGPLPRDGGGGLRARGERGSRKAATRASRSRWRPSSRRCSSPGPSRRAAGRRSRSPPTCRSRPSRSPA